MAPAISLEAPFHKTHPLVVPSKLHKDLVKIRFLSPHSELKSPPPQYILLEETGFHVAQAGLEFYV